MEPNDTNKIIYVKDENGEYVPETERQRPKKSRVVSSAERRERIIFWVRFAALAVLETLFCFIMLNVLPNSPLPLSLAMVFVVITAVMYGPSMASVIGAVGGTASIIAYTFLPQASKVAFVYSPFVSGGGLHSPLVSLIPFILAGAITAVSYSGISAIHTLHLKKSGKSKAWWHTPLIYAICAAVGAMLHVALTAVGISLCFPEAFANAAGYDVALTPIMLGGLILTKGTVEAILCALLTVAICIPFNFIKEKFKGKA